MNVTGTPFTCLHPNYVVNPYTHQKIAAYCGKCAACVARKARRYETQIQLEAQNSAAVLFVTLTYANSYVPKMELVPVTEELAYSNTVKALLVKQQVNIREDTKRTIRIFIH